MPGCEEHASEIAAFFEGRLSEPLATFSAHDLSGAMIGFAEPSIRLEIAGLERKPTGYVEGLYVILLVAIKQWRANSSSQLESGHAIRAA